jgi:hypothetical protein
MADQVTTTELVRQMSGKDTLNGWDVLVSYDEAQINVLLNLRAETITTLTNIVFNTEEDCMTLSAKDCKTHLTPDKS